MGRHDDIPRGLDRHALLAIAEQAFRKVREGDSDAARHYRRHPQFAGRDWAAIRNDLDALLGADAAQHARLLRGRLATCIESLVAVQYYRTLGAQDRDDYARFVMADRDAMDEHYRYCGAHYFAYSWVLETIVCVRDPGSTADARGLGTMQSRFMTCCKDYCALIMEVARARACGGHISEEQADWGRWTIAFKEQARQRLLEGDAPA